MLQSIKDKLIIAFSVLAVLLIVVGLTVMRIYLPVGPHYRVIDKNSLPRVIFTNAINTAISELRIVEALHIISTEDEEMTRQENGMQKLLQQIAYWRRQYEPIISSAKEKSKYKEFSQRYEQYLTTIKEVMSLSRKNLNKEAAAKLKENSKVYEDMRSNLQNLVNINKYEAFQAAKANADKLDECSSTLKTVLQYPACPPSFGRDSGFRF